MNRDLKARILGRDPTMGRLAFRTGIALSRKVKMRNRKSKLGQENLRRQLKGM